MCRSVTATMLMGYEVSASTGLLSPKSHTSRPQVARELIGMSAQGLRSRTSAVRPTSAPPNTSESVVAKR